MKAQTIAAEAVSAYDAKTHLPKLLERTARGERFVITRHGKPVAQLIPVTRDDAAALAQVLKRVTGLRARLERKGITLAVVLEPGESLRALSHAGHRF